MKFISKNLYRPAFNCQVSRETVSDHVKNGNY